MAVPTVAVHVPTITGRGGVQNPTQATGLMVFNSNTREVTGAGANDYRMPYKILGTNGGSGVTDGENIVIIKRPSGARFLDLYAYWGADATSVAEPATQAEVVVFGQFLQNDAENALEPAAFDSTNCVDLCTGILGGTAAAKNRSIWMPIPSYPAGTVENTFDGVSQMHEQSTPNFAFSLSDPLRFFLRGAGAVMVTVKTAPADVTGAVQMVVGQFADE